MKRLAPILRLLHRVTPRPIDLGAAVGGALAGLVPLAVLRVVIAKQTLPRGTFLDYWRTLYGEIQCWLILALAAALLLRLTAEGRAHRAFRVSFHVACAILLLLSIVELVFFGVTGSRADFDLLGFFVRDTSQVLPVVASEVHGLHLAGLAFALVVGLAPLRIRLSRDPAPRRSLAVLALLAAPLVWIEQPSRARPAKALRELQPSLVEHLYWDGFDRIGESTIPPRAGELDPLHVRRTGGGTPPNIVLVVLESVGLNNTSLGEGKLPASPYLAEMASEGLLVEEAYAVVPHTSKALVTTLCGYWPKLVSEIREAHVGGLPNRCLPELLEQVGYRTAFFQTARESFEYRGELTRRMGFDLFRARDTLKRPGFEKVNYFGIEDRAMIAPGLKWSEEGDGPFFATYLTLTSHHDYGIPEAFPPIDFEGVTGRREEHLNAVRYVDTFLKELVEAHEKAGLAENTVFIVLGDHGEAFGEHGRSQHDLVIYEEGLRIPFVIYGPGVLGRTGVVEGPRQQIDVLPTVLELAGAEIASGGVPGSSVLAQVPEDRELFHSCWRSHRCLASREEGLKVIDHYREAPAQAFDLAGDPRERRDLAPTLDAARIAAKRDAMREWRARVNGFYEARHAVELEKRQYPDRTSPAIATWDGKLELLGCTSDMDAVIPSQAFWLTCRWRAKEEMKMAWRLEARMETESKAVTEVEIEPFDGELPTFRWRPGWVVEDEIRVYAPAGARPGRARVELTWERYGDTRIRIDGGGDHVQVATVEILARPKYEGVAVSDDVEEDEDETARK